MNYSYEEDMILETDCESTSSVADSPISVVSTSPPASSRPRALQKNHVEHEDEDAEDMVLESDSASISLLFEPMTPVSASPPDNPPSRPVIPRLNPDAPHFIPRCAFLLSTADVPAAQVRLPHSVSDSHVDGGITAVQREDETMYPIIRSLWPAETTDVDDIAFLLYFGLIDLGSP
ncbi:hypothetical protein L208DRAFT_59515 [Tricholoma matsutake]|nr:hypothetical protein L208DRAFT_772729 [Tricholoma matsutake 945]KAF8231566.1 hypothetical protein L208DRAFT_59515 [Tricholoma matsutake 945]